MTALTCPHCSAANNSGDAFCKACGMALPQVGAPRIVGKGDFAATTAGVSLQSDELRTQLKRSSSTLLIVAVIQTISAIAVYVILNSERDNLADPHAAQNAL